MAYSPYSRGSNSNSPQSHPSPGQYPVKAEPMHPGLHMGGPRLIILEEPQERFRFRYESELGGTHGQLAGRSGADRRSFPTVKVEGLPLQQRATIRCELFTVEENGTNMTPVPHVHTLQGRNCSGGYAEMRVDQENDFTASFQGLGIIHTAKKQMADKITNRKLDEKKMEMERVNMGKLWNPTDADRQEAREQANRESQRINMNRVCLRFKALYNNPNTMRTEQICSPVYSGPIFNGKSAQTGELKIVQLSEAFSPCTGNKEIWLLVERVRKNDIKVLVYEEDSTHQMIWSDYGRVIKCHHQYAIIFQTPAYRDKEIRSPVRVFIQLERPSDGCVSEPKHFQFTERDQRTTKRMLTQVEGAGPSSSKRYLLDSEQGKESWAPMEPEVHFLRKGLPQPGHRPAGEPCFGRFSPERHYNSPERRHSRSPERRLVSPERRHGSPPRRLPVAVPRMVPAEARYPSDVIRYAERDAVRRRGLHHEPSPPPPVAPPAVLPPPPPPLLPPLPLPPTRAPDGAMDLSLSGLSSSGGGGEVLGSWQFPAEYAASAPPRYCIPTVVNSAPIRAVPASYDPRAAAAAAVENLTTLAEHAGRAQQAEQAERAEAERVERAERTAGRVFISVRREFSSMVGAPPHKPRSAPPDLIRIMPHPHHPSRPALSPSTPTSTSVPAPVLAPARSPVAAPAELADAAARSARWKRVARAVDERRYDEAYRAVAGEDARHQHPREGLTRETLKDFAIKDMVNYGLPPRPDGEPRCTRRSSGEEDRLVIDAEPEPVAGTAGGGGSGGGGGGEVVDYVNTAAGQVKISFDVSKLAGVGGKGLGTLGAMSPGTRADSV